MILFTGRLQFLFALTLLLLLAPAGHASTETAFQSIRPLLFQVKSSASANLEKNSYGTGFVIDKDGLLITNYHVVAGALWKPESHKIFVLMDGENQEAEILSVDFINDLALIRVNKTFDQALKIASKPPVIGEAIYSLGLPQDIEWSIVSGTYNGSVHRGPYEVIHMTTSLNPGMSGGPTINSRNELVAVNSSGYWGSQQISFGVPFAKVKALIEKKKDYTSGKKADFIRQLQEQLIAHQKTMTEQILASFKAKKKIGFEEWPNLAKYVRCWGKTKEADERLKYDFETEMCELENNVNLARGNTGYYKFQFSGFTNKELGPIAWRELKAREWDLENLVKKFDKTSMVNYSGPKCDRERIASSGATFTISVCSQQVLPLKDIHETHVKIIKSIDNNHFTKTLIKLAGFTKDNTKEIIQTFIASEEKSK